MDSDSDKLPWPAINEGDWKWTFPVAVVFTLLAGFVGHFDFFSYFTGGFVGLTAASWLLKISRERL